MFVLSPAQNIGRSNLRNSVTTATMTALTAALGLMGALGLAAPALRTLSESGGSPVLTPALAGRSRSCCCWC